MSEAAKQTDLEKAHALFAKLREADEYTAFTIHPSSAMAGTHHAEIKMDTDDGGFIEIDYQDPNPLAAANSAKAAYLLLKHGDRVVEAIDALACELAETLGASVDELFAGTRVGKQAAEALAPFAATEVE
jgi:hypothetical protein